MELRQEQDNHIVFVPLPEVIFQCHFLAVKSSTAKRAEVMAK